MSKMQLKSTSFDLEHAEENGISSLTTLAKTNSIKRWKKFCKP